MKRLLAASALLATMSTAAFAENYPDYHPAMPDGSFDHIYDRSGFGVNVGATTLGFAVEPVWRLSNKFGVRALYGEGDASYDESSNGETYEGNVATTGAGIMADFYPTGKSFFVSGGAFQTDYSADFTATNVTVGGNTGDIDVRIAQNNDGIVPYLGMGYDGRLGQHGTLSLSAGGIFGDGFNVTATDRSGNLTQAQVDAEIADIRSTANDLNVIPFAKIAIGFRF